MITVLKLGFERLSYQVCSHFDRVLRFKSLSFYNWSIQLYLESSFITNWLVMFDFIRNQIAVNVRKFYGSVHLHCPHAVNSAIAKGF